MSALRTRRQPRSSTSDRTEAQPSREYDDNRLRGEEPMEVLLGGQDLASNGTDFDDAEESDLERAVELAGNELGGGDITAPIVPQRTNEFLCSSCFLINHLSRLANSKDGQLICADCA